ncbi:MAG TPA: CoA transferase [Tepidiformaceae bacterium]
MTTVVPAPHGPLAHLRVLDLSVFAQGGVAGGLLRELGAEVIKIERPGRGDPGRALTEVRPGVSTFFEVFNRGKRSVALDLSRPGGRKVLLRLAEGCDVFLHNARPGVMARLGLDYEDVRAVNPEIVYAEGSGFGPLGPDAAHGVVDIIGQARGGLVAVTGTGRPTPAGAIVSDHLGAVYLAVGILAALVHRERTGEGQRVECSMLGAMIAAQGWEFGHYLVTGTPPARSGRVHHLMGGLWGIFETADGFLALTGVPPEAWPPFLELIERPDLARDERFATPLARRDFSDELAQEVAAAFLHMPTEPLVDRMSGLDIRCTRVQDYERLAADPQVTENGYVISVDHPVLGKVRVPANPLRLSRTPAETPVAAPRLGEDTESVLAAFGVTPGELKVLRTEGTIQSPGGHDVRG